MLRSTTEPPLPRVVSVGFNKCATRSLAEMFRRAGHKVIHHKVRDRWPVPRRVGAVMRSNLDQGRKVFDGIEDYTFYCDLIVNDGATTYDGASAFREILRDYPDTILLLNLRDREAWIASRLRHGHGEFAKREMAATGAASQEELAELWRQDWDDHVSAVRTFMSDHPDQFVEFNLDHDTAEDLAAQFPRHGLNPSDFEDIGRTRDREMSVATSWLKTVVAHRRPRFFR